MLNKKENSEEEKMSVSKSAWIYVNLPEREVYGTKKGLEAKIESVAKEKLLGVTCARINGEPDVMMLAVDVVKYEGRLYNENSESSEPRDIRVMGNRQIAEKKLVEIVKEVLSDEVEVDLTDWPNFGKPRMGFVLKKINYAFQERVKKKIRDIEDGFFESSWYRVVMKSEAVKKG